MKRKTKFELATNNPFEGLKIRNKPAHVSGVSSEENDRRSFTPEELLQYEDILKTKKSEIKTIGLLMIWTGCRTMEIGGLLNNELLLDLNVPYLLIRPNSIRGLKTLASERKVPLTADGIRYVEGVPSGTKEHSTLCTCISELWARWGYGCTFSKPQKHNTQTDEDH